MKDIRQVQYYYDSRQSSDQCDRTDTMIIMATSSLCEYLQMLIGDF